ncbi:hypothetical protein T484DRAFT_1867125 [Baffinella frigidus]|nr:hypothetical protein T484DRAFT_1867125 [Cryptophyta sp. CCMP2293]
MCSRLTQSGVLCSDPSVVVATGAHPADTFLQEVHVKYRCGAAGQASAFYVVLYNDRSNN